MPLTARFPTVFESPMQTTVICARAAATRPASTSIFARAMLPERMGSPVEKTLGRGNDG